MVDEPMEAGIVKRAMNNVEPIPFQPVSKSAQFPRSQMRRKKNDAATSGQRSFIVLQALKGNGVVNLFPPQRREVRTRDEHPG